MPKISVIIPAYNAERTILETIQSVQQQTFPDWEIIVINDGSIDITLEILESIDDPRLKIFSYQNGGLSVARNRGISQAVGEFIAFLDADDLWTPDKLELQLAALQQYPEAGVAYSWTYFFHEKDKILIPGVPVSYEGNVIENLLLGNFLDNGSNPLIRKAAIESVGEFDPAFPHYADWDYYLRLAEKWNFVLVPKYQILYRQSSSSMSSKVDSIKADGLIMLEKAFTRVPQELQFLNNQSLSRLHQYYAGLYLQHNSDVMSLDKAGENLWLAITKYPKILVNIRTQKLILKYCLKRLLPLSLSTYLIELIRKLRVNIKYQMENTKSN